MREQPKVLAIAAAPCPFVAMSMTRSLSLIAFVDGIQNVAGVAPQSVEAGDDQFVSRP